MNINELDEWASAYYFTDLGLSVPGDIGEYYTLETYLQKFLIPMKLLTTTVPQDSIKFGVIGKYDESTFEYLNGLPVFMSIGKASAYMTSKFGTKCWRHCLIDIIKELPANIEEPCAKIDSAIEKVLYNYSKRLVTFDLEGGDTLIYVHNLTHAPIGDYPEELVVYPDSVMAFPGKHTLYELSQTEPVKLTQDERRVLTAAVNVPLLSRGDLLSGKCYMPVGKELGYVEVDALSPLLPPPCVIDIIDIMPDSMVEKYGDEYHALAAYIAGCQPSMVEPDAFVYLEQIKEFLDTPLVLDDTTIQPEKLPEELESVVPETATLSEYSDAEIIEEAARRLDCSVNKLVESRSAATENVVPTYINDTALSAEITDSDVVHYLNEKFGRSANTLSELIDTSAPEITDEVILNRFNERTGCNYKTLQEITEYKSDDAAIDAALDILKYMRSVLREDTDIEERVKARALSRIVNVIAVSHDKGANVKVAFDMLIESIDQDRPDYVRIAKQAVNKYLGTAV